MQRLPPISPVLHAALTRHSSAAFILEKHGLLEALVHLRSLGHEHTNDLLTTMQQCYPPSSDLTLPQYKKRSIETCLSHMQIMDKFIQKEHPRTVLLGDSMFERMSRGHGRMLLPILQPSTEKLVNFAVGGDGVQNLRCRLDIAFSTYLRTTPIFILHIGVNNILGRVKGSSEHQLTSSPATAVVDGIEGIIDYIFKNAAVDYSTQKIYICQLLHVLGASSSSADGAAAATNAVNEQIDEVNDRLQRLLLILRSDSLAWVPTVMERKPALYTPDGVHLSRDGYASLLSQLPDAVRKHSVKREGASRKRRMKR